MTMTLERPTPDAVSLDLPFEAESAGVARGRLGAWLAPLSADRDRLDDARLLISELVGNSVRHARPLDDRVLRVEWCVDDAPTTPTLAIAVTDGGSGLTAPRVVEAADGDLGGRGMAIIEHVARRWWVERDAACVRVVAEIPLD